MIIGIDASRANNQNKTGVEWYAWHLIENLKKLNISQTENIQFVLYSREKLQGNLGDLPPNWTEKVLHWKPKFFWTQIRLSWEMFTNPPDVLFVPSHVYPAVHPKKTVMTIHDIAAKRFPGSYSWFQRWYTMHSAKAGMKKMWKIIVPSEFTKQELLSLKMEQHRDKIKVIQHGYDNRYGEQLDEAEKIKVLEKYNIKRPYILSIGRLEKKKNTKRIVQAFNHVAGKVKDQNLSLVLVGQPGYGYEKVKQMIDESNFKSNIITPGYIEPGELKYILSSARVFVFPSLYEGFGLPVLDAFAAGVPVIASSGSSLEEVGGDACVYADKNDTWNIAKYILQFLESDEVRDKYIKQGRERVSGFSWGRCAEKTFNSLIN